MSNVKAVIFTVKGKLKHVILPMSTKYMKIQTGDMFQEDSITFLPEELFPPTIIELDK